MARYEAKLNSDGWDVAETVNADCQEAAIRKAAKKLGYTQSALDRGYSVQREGSSQWGITMHDGNVIHLVELAENS